MKPKPKMLETCQQITKLTHELDFDDGKGSWWTIRRVDADGEWRYEARAHWRPYPWDASVEICCHDLETMPLAAEALEWQLRYELATRWEPRTERVVLS